MQMAIASVSLVLAIVVVWLHVWWALRLLRAAETTSQASRETRELVRQLSSEVVQVKRQLTG